MYYYEFQINGNNRLYQSKHKYSETIIENAISEFMKNYKGSYFDVTYDIISHLSYHYGILPYNSGIKSEFDINLDYYENTIKDELY